MLRRSTLRALRVPNKESTARDHLANERTFLAWSRTALAFLAAGLGLEAVELSPRRQQRRPHDSDSDSAAAAAPPPPADAVAWALRYAREPRTRQHLMSLAFVTTGTCLFSFAVRRYFTVMRALQKGDFIIADRGIRSVSVAVFSVLVGCYGVQLATAPDFNMIPQ